MGCLFSTPATTSERQRQYAAKVQKAAVGGVLQKPMQDVREYYTIGKELGKGQFGVTRLATCKTSGKKVACKSISKRKMTCPEDIEDVRREVQIMHHLAGHENIPQLYAEYEDRTHVHIVMELCGGGDMFASISQRHHYSEKDAAAVIRTILSVVAHCHTMGVIHRDLKFENFLLSDKTDNAVIKCTDFGLSTFFRPGQMFTDIVGSAYYIAPEVLKQYYSKEADIWSCGVILYILLCGSPPFYGDTETEVFNSIRHRQLAFESSVWRKVSEQAKQVVRMMLVRNPVQRATARQILEHDWIKVNGTASDKPLGNEVTQRMQSFAAMNRLKKEALLVIANNLPEVEIVGLKNLFENMDADGNGTITVQELRKGLLTKSSALPEADLRHIMEAADVNGDGTIDYREFIACTMHLNKANRQEHLIMAFAKFDVNNDGFITVDELRSALGDAQGVDGDVNTIIKEIDRNGDGKIDYEEFAAMMGSKVGGGVNRNVSLRSHMRI